ncbi:hypothetical protein N44_01105 [Microcystis aeruginosa NIES-44]|uniref:Uncharacterized protein n=1 Tax=Microcystis aeruginosa NIES-44 TaxID=449439 RepID=A0A0A1VRV0_MICAE|nr:hypothetical protein N44_01105 [Microcystis aeruginosa NIES-44]
MVGIATCCVISSVIPMLISVINSEGGIGMEGTGSGCSGREEELGF